MKRINIYEEANRCLLCQDAPCTKACKTGDPARAIRAIRFDNHKPALKWVANCTDADLEAAEQACIHYNWPIRIKELIRTISPDDVPSDNYPDLSIDFCGIHCENPFFLASSAVCTNYEMVARAFEAGWAGVFYKTICLQDIKEVSPRFDAVHSNGTHGDFYGFRNMEQLSENPVDIDFDILRRLKQNYPSKVVIASIMGQTEQQWADLAIMAERAGVDAGQTSPIFLPLPRSATSLVPMPFQPSTPSSLSRWLPRQRCQAVEPSQAIPEGLSSPSPYAIFSKWPKPKR